MLRETVLIACTTNGPGMSVGTYWVVGFGLCFWGLLAKALRYVKGLSETQAAWAGWL